MVVRALEDWVTSYLKYVENTEPPLSYHTWAGVSTISGAMERKTYMKWGHSFIYGNQYVVLVGPSGQVRKGEALMPARWFLNKVGVRLVSESITREALIRSMKEGITNYTDPTTNSIKFQCGMTCVSEELSVLLGEKNTGFLADLTNWYDSRDEWTYETKHSGTDKIVGVCLNLLGATAPDWFSYILPHEAMGGGWTSRVIFVVEEYKRKTVANPNLVEENLDLKAQLLNDLEQINSMCGEMHFDEHALKLYTEWYQQEEDAIRSGNPTIVDPRLKGYSSRRATHVKKIAMAMSASRSNDLVVNANDFNRALALLIRTEKKMPRVFGGYGRARFASATEAILQHIILRKRVKRSEILRQFYTDVDTFTLDCVEKVLYQMGVIEIEYEGGSIDTTYIYKDTKGEENGIR